MHGPVLGGEFFPSDFIVRQRKTLCQDMVRPPGTDAGLPLVGIHGSGITKIRKRKCSAGFHAVVDILPNPGIQLFIALSGIGVHISADNGRKAVLDHQRSEPINQFNSIPALG